MRFVRRLRGRIHSSPSQCGDRHSGGDATASSWEITRSCPGSLKSSRRSHGVSPRVTPRVTPRVIARLERHQRHLSDPGKLELEEVVCEQPSKSSSVQESRWSLYKATSHRDEVFDPGHDLDYASGSDDERDNVIRFSIKQAICVRSHRFISAAILFSAIYLVYALYVTITRVRSCKIQTLPMVIP